MADVFDMLFSQDPCVKLFNHLRSALPSQVQVYQHSLPEKWNPSRGLAVVVADDATQASDTGHDRVLVRVTVHSHSFDLSRKFGKSIYEYLLSPMVGLGLSISRTRSTKPIVGPDSLAGGFISTASYSCGSSRKKVS